MNEVKTGSVEGTGAAINVSLGFKPDIVTVLNIDDPTRLEWARGMGQGKGVKLNDTPALTFISSSGISDYDGDDDNPAGFTIGADTDVNVDGENLVWIAMRNGEGAQ